jgi:hypothetical protein
MTGDGAEWLALIISLPARNATARMRVWRGLKALGCGVLRDGVYLLPARNAARELLMRQQREVVAAGGSSQLVELKPADEAQESRWRKLFDRAADYSKFSRHARTLKAPAGPAASARAVRSLRREFEAIAAIDFFPGPAHDQAKNLRDETERAMLARLSRDEPSAAARAIEPCSRKDYQRRVWATRKHPWVDRLASAWLIKRFVDRAARFVWLERPRDCPARAVGFDFDGAEFTHVGNRVTFEVMVMAFRMDADPALARLGRLVHYLDTGGIPVADADGLRTILLGARARCRGDDRLLAEALRIFDFLYAAYKENPDDE